MSTFGGVIDEFPDIRVDYFRPIRGRRPPLTGFLSHIHSDHLTGLDTYKGPFVYCSQATRELLLRLERYPHRLNFALGKLESRKQQYKHLKKLLKPIPLETPTRIELEPGNEIQVTLFDANHCIGAVMFLIEGDGKAVLYTGDIRSELWFVNNLTRSPFLIEYTSGLKQLDCLYLDTSHTQPVEFPSKAEGLQELLQKVSQYPPETVFHFSAWTFGYEEVWMALSKKLESAIHVDDYKLKLYQSLRVGSNGSKDSPVSFQVSEAPALAGFQCGNSPQVGCLTHDTSVRIHSCEKGMRCDTVTDNTVWIRPIVTRTKLGVEIAEVGVGGGGGDLTQRPELEFDNDEVILQLLDAFSNTDSSVLSDIKQMLHKCRRSNQQTISLDDMGLDQQEDNLDFSHLGQVLARAVTEKRNEIATEDPDDLSLGKSLPKVITFPYARHSSYFELCHIVKAFNPKDIYPCTVDEENWHEGVSMKSLFGQHCSPTVFRHDEEMRELQTTRLPQVIILHSQATDSNHGSQNSQLTTADIVEMGETVIVRKASVTTAMRGDKATPPPHEILAVSPGQESQGLRRKAVLEHLVEDRVKRICLQFDHDELSSASDSQIQDEGETSNMAEGREKSSPRHMAIPATTADDLHARGQTSTDEKSGTDTENAKEYWDPADEVFRCGFCRHELWMSGELCARCSTENASESSTEGLSNRYSENTYSELIDPNLRSKPSITVNEDDTDITLNTDERAELMGDVLDFDSSAYDSQDERGEHDDAYEIDSFIDDDSIDNSSDDGDDSSSDEGIDYKKKFLELQKSYFNITEEYHDYVEESEEFRRYVLGSDYESSHEEDDLGPTEDGVVMVDAPAPDPVLAEVVLSQSEQDSESPSLDAESADSLVDEIILATAGGQEESQNFDDPAEEVDARVEAYELALDGRWHDVSLVSTGGNHSHEEAEL